MGINSNGSSRFLLCVTNVALLAMTTGLLACAQAPSDDRTALENPMQGSPSPQDARAEQDRAAAAVDEAARAASTDKQGQAPSTEQPAPPQAPDLTPATLEAGIVRLAGELREVKQTQPLFVGQTLGIALASYDDGKRAGARGALGSGTYTVEIETLYPTAPGQHVSIRIDQSESQPCALNFDRLAQHLEAAGYKGKRAPQGLDPSMSFSRDLGPLKGFVQLDLDRYTSACIWQINFDLEAKQDGRPED
ncbi:hypothetical protein SAMN05421681_10642 [Lysobacter enzymogenes]|nr:hypothetical protein SAMN05421681_10642 [Lysobacter enzymogenes]